MAIQYYYKFDDDGVVYSIDMLRYKFSISKFYKSFPSRLNRFLNHNCKRVILHRSLNSFVYGRYGVLFDCELINGGKLVIGFDLLSVCESWWECFIEFNPNKCLDVVDHGIDSHVFDIIEFIRKWEAPNLPIFKLVRFDIAIDFSIPRDRFVLVRKNGRTYHKIIGDSLTEYLGQKNSDGYVKLYDKSYEHNLELKKQLKEDLKRIKFHNKYVECSRKHNKKYNNDWDTEMYMSSSDFDCEYIDINDEDMQEYFEYYKLKEDITRLEITCSNVEKLNLPEIYILGDRQTDISVLPDTQQVLVKLLNNLNPDEKSEYINQLSRHTREKLKPYVLGSNELFKYNTQILNTLCEIAVYPNAYIMPDNPFDDNPVLFISDRPQIIRDTACAAEYYPEASETVPENFDEIYEDNEDAYSQYRIDDYLDAY